MAKPYRPRRWRSALPDPAACWLLSQELSISPVTAQVLYNRGLTTPDAARAFLTAGRDQILDPFLLKDMDRAVALIRRRIAEGGPIMVYGDYDVDGVTGSTVLVLALRALGAKVDYYIPNRFNEGYGLNVGALREIRERGYDFILSVDTGVSAIQEAEAAKELGITLVISDHHEPGPELPDVPALINPKRADCSYPFKGLSGVGVAFKLALALEAPGAWDLIDIVTMGTIADMVPLIGENRAIVREGLAALGATRRPGLRALMEVAGVKQPITATHIGYSLGPRINALGRMGSAMQGVELLTTDNEARAKELARLLDDENRSRQEVEAGILEEALRQAELQRPQDKEFVLVLAGEGWHHGVVGICASRVLEAYHRPAIMLAIDGDGARGSARSIPAFHLHRALLQVYDLFVKFGGHAAAAGMTLKTHADIPQLRERLNRLGAQWLKPDDLIPELRVDAYIGLEQVTDQLMSELRALEPHGIGNPSPVFAARDAAVCDSRFIGREENHIKLMLKGGSMKAPMEAVGWSMAPAMPGMAARVQVAFNPEYNIYNGRSSLRINLRDLQVIDSPDDRGFPVHEAVLPQVSEAALLRWDPLTVGHRQRPPILVDAREERLSAVLAQFQAPHTEVAAAAAGDAVELELEAPEPTRLRYIEVLAAPRGSRLLVRTASPWAAAGLVADLQKVMPDRKEEIRLWAPGEAEPEAGAIIVAPYGLHAAGSFSDTLLYHPPYDEGQMPGGRVHLLWERADWALARAVLGWPYPERESLVALFKLLRKGEASPERLALELVEAPGPWNRLRLEAGLAIFREMGLLGPDGRLIAANGTGKFDLEASSRYCKGAAARDRLIRLQASDWPSSGEAL